jgi:Ser/Thr protein kinase RdoA (MazF antagonist)
VNAHRRFLGAEDLQKFLVRAGIDSPLTGQSLLTGGTFNSVYQLSFADRPGVVLKLSPDPRGAVMTYERGIVKTEALFYAMAQDRAALPVPTVIAVLDVDLDLGGGQALLVTELPGVPWFGSGVSGAMRGPLRAELGRLMASMHAVMGPAFGYPSESTGALSGRWFEAFAAMLDAVLDDADRYQAVLPVDPRRVRRALNACVDDLDAVLVPSLVHFDLWDGNVLIDLDGPPRISGLIDGERAMWGDPVMDFASAALFGEIRDDDVGERATGGADGRAPTGGDDGGARVAHGVAASRTARRSILPGAVRGTASTTIQRRGNHSGSSSALARARTCDS